MSLRERIEPRPGHSHLVLRVLARLNSKQQEEFLDCLDDPNITSAQLAKAVKQEWGMQISAERIRNWRQLSGPERESFKSGR